MKEEAVLADDTCSNCGAKIGQSFFKNNEGAPAYLVEFLDEIKQEKKGGYCKNCVQEELTKEVSKADKSLKEIRASLNENIAFIPIITAHSPMSWDYRSIGIVTGQSTIGTGWLSGFESSLADFLGSQSGTYNSKLAQGEEICFAQLRKKTFALGGNAVIATDIDYAEVGTSKGMLMVCASGTSVEIKNIEVLGEKASSAIGSLYALRDEEKQAKELVDKISKILKSDKFIHPIPLNQSGYPLRSS